MNSNYIRGIFIWITVLWIAKPCNAAIYTDQVKGNFRAKVEQVAAHLKVDPDYLIAVMALETAKPSNPGRGTPTFDPTITNATTGAVGLVQFMPSIARALGTSSENLKRMTAVEQMDYVEKLLLPQKGKMNSLVDTYLAVLLPSAMGKPDDFQLPDQYYKGNEGLDADGNGKISKAEIATKIQHYFDRGKS